MSLGSDIRESGQEGTLPVTPKPPKSSFLREGRTSATVVMESHSLDDGFSQATSDRGGDGGGDHARVSPPAASSRMSAGTQ